MIALALAQACSDGGSGSPGEENLPTEVVAEVGTKGGTLKAKGMTLEIPPGALDKTVEISAKSSGQTAPKEVGAKQVSDVYEFGPEGTKFNKDVTVTFHAKSDADKAEVYFTKEDSDEFEKIDSAKSGEEVTARVKHFSRGFLGVPLDDADAGPGLDAGQGMDASEPLDAPDVVPDAEQTSADSGLPSEDASAGGDGGIDPESDAALSDGGFEAEAGLPPTTHIVVHSRDRFGVLVNQTWAAFQDGPQGAWQALAPSSTGVYEFDVAAVRYGVAFVCSAKDLSNSWGTLNFATTGATALDVVTQGPPCTSAAPPVFTLSGTLGLGSDQYWRYGHAHESSGVGFSTIPVSLTMTQFRPGELNDVLFASGPNPGVDAGPDQFQTVNRFALRRNVALSGNQTGFNVDMVKDGVVAAGTATAQVLGGDDATSVDVRYVTRNNTQDGIWLNTSSAGGSDPRSVTFALLPSGVRQVTDRYLVVGSQETASQWRKAVYATDQSGNLSVTLPAAFGVVFDALQTPYLRPTFDVVQVPGAGLYAFGVHYSPQRGSNHTFDIDVTPAWFTGSSLTFPDFSAVAGFDPSWVAPAGASVSAKAAVHAKSSGTNNTLTTESGQAATVPAPTAL